MVEAMLHQGMLIMLRWITPPLWQNPKSKESNRQKGKNKKKRKRQSLSKALVSSS